MRVLVAIALILVWMVLVAAMAYLVGAWIMLDWDYVTVISSYDRGGMVAIFFILLLATFMLPGIVYEEIFNP